MSEFDDRRDPLDLLAEEFAQRQRQGQHPSVTEYAERYPDLAEQIRDLFPAVAAMEQLRRHKEGGSLSSTSAEGSRVASVPVLERLGDCRILREIGRGGMGVVFEAHQESLGRRVALKVLPPGAMSAERSRQRFEREARVAARLHHTNIVPVFGVGREDGIAYYVMQYIEGLSLGDLIGAWRTTTTAGASKGRSTDAWRAPVRPASPDPAACGTQSADDAPMLDAVHLPPIAPDEALGYCRWVAQVGVQAADALQYAHAHGVLHRDIKPPNLLIDGQGTVWITDFGVARPSEEEELTHSGDVVGTLRYMAPEQLNGAAEPRSDVYALGLTLYELAALRPAFDETNRSRLLRQVMEGEVPPLARVRPDVPRDLETIIAKAIAREPQRRYATAGELADDLRRFLDDQPIRARRVGSVERLWRWCRRHRAVASLSGLALALWVLAATVGWIGYLQTTAALDQAEAATRRAEANLDLSLDAFETIFNRLAGRDALAALPDDPEIDWPLPAVPSEHDLALLEELLRFYERYAEGNQANERLRAGTAKAYRRVGAIQQILGRPEKSEDALRRALAAYEDLSQEEGGRKYAAEIAAAWNVLGTTLQSAGRFDEARKALEQALQQAEEADSDRGRLELIRAHNSLGRSMALFGPGRWRGPRAKPGPEGSRPGPEAARPGPGPDASRPGPEGPRPGREGPPPGPEGPRPADRGAETVEHHRQALRLAQGLVERSPQNPEYRFALACSQEYLATALVWRSAGKEAAEANAAAIRLLRDLAAEHPTVAAYRRELAECLAAPGGPPWLRLQSADATARIEEAVTIAEQLHKDYPQVPEYALFLARTLTRSAMFLGARDESDEAVRRHRRAIEVSEALVGRYPAVPSFGFLLAWHRSGLAEYLRLVHRLPEARAELEKAIQLAEKMPQDDPAPSRGARGLRTRLYRSLATTLRQMGETQAADEAAEKARAIGP